MKWRVIAPFLFMALVAPDRVYAEFITGNDLLNHCQAQGEREGFAGGYCLGYVLAVVDGQDRILNTMLESLFSSSMATPPSLQFCVPIGVTAGQLVLIANKYLSENPAKLHLSATALVTSAFKATFPCSDEPENKGSEKP